MQSIITLKKILKSTLGISLSIFMLLSFCANTGNAQTTLTTTFANNNGNSLVTFNFTNNNASAVIITNIASVTGTAGPITVRAFFKASAIAGPPGAISVANGWNQFGTAIITGIANTTTSTPQPFLSGLSLSVPAGATYGIAVQAPGLRYSTLAAGTYPTTGGGAVLTTGTNIGYGGGLAPAAPTFTPRGFIGSVTFMSSVPCTGTPNPGATNSTLTSVCPGTSFTLSPANSTSGTGVTYQFQSSPTAGGTFTNIPGATSPTFTTTLTSTTFFRVVVICGADSTGTSTPVQVSLNINSITSSPSNTTATCGGNATFTAGAAGTNAMFQWQFRVNATSPWLTVPNAPPYSGVNTATLTITGVTAAMNGYEYRAIVSGECTGANATSPATLTVTPVVAVVTPASATICAGAIQAIALTNTLGNINTINEGFNTVLPAGWARQNNSQPLGPSIWTQGDPTVFPAFNGAPNSYAAADFASTDPMGVGTISNWLFTPAVSIKNGDIVSFYSRIPAGTEFPDRLELRLSTNGTSTNVGTTATSVGDFTTLLLTINPAVVINVYPKVWTQFTATISGLASPATGRLALRYFTPNAGGNAPNGNYIGVDNFVYTSTGATAQGVYSTISPAGGPNTIFTDPAATVAYTGTPITTVYVKPAVTTTYAVTYTTPGGCVSTPDSITVTVNTPIAGTPTLNNVAACAGTAGVFTVSGITAGTGLTYQFQVNSLAAPTVFTNVGTASATPTFTVPNVDTSRNGRQYRVIVTAPGCTGSVTSAPATLTVNPTPVVTLSAAPRANLFPGLTTTLTANVTTGTQPFTFQFFRNGVLVPGTIGNMITVGIDQIGTYTVRATDANGCISTAATSSPLTIGDSTGVTTLFIFPSPNSGQFQVRYFNDVTNTSQTPSMVNVYDQKGARVFTRTYVAAGSGFQAMNVDLGVHSRGIYRVELVSTNGERIKTGTVLVF